MIDWLFRAMSWVSAALAAIVMFVIFVNVVARYVFNSPISGTFEVIEVSMGLIVFTALPRMIRMRGNIAVTILSDRFPPRLGRAVATASDLLAAAISGFIAWRIWLQGERMLRYGEVTMELRIPKGLIAQGISAMMALAALAFLICAWESVRGRMTRNTGGENV